MPQAAHPLESLCAFHTERCQFIGYHPWAQQSQSDPQALLAQIAALLTPKVTRSLPGGWSAIESLEQAQQWLQARLTESAVFLLLERSSGTLLGFVFLYQDEATSRLYRLGYLQAESSWGKGYASEWLAGLLQWCRASEAVETLLAGVEPDNPGSIRVLEKNGFGNITPAGAKSLMYRWRA